MKYELELYVNELGAKTEKIIVEGTGVSVLDTTDGAMLLIKTAKGTITYMTSQTRIKAMRAISSTSSNNRNLHVIPERDKKTARNRG